MAPATEEAILLHVNSIDQIFNAPDADPFSENKEDALGEAALERVLVRLQAHPLRDWKDAQLVLVLPPDQITEDLQQRLAAALKRYCTARIEANQLQIHLSRVQHTIGMIAVTFIVLVAGLMAFVLLKTILADSPPVIQGMIVAGVSVFAWVILWDPMEALLFEWVAPARENRTLRRLMEMHVVVQPQS